MAKNDEIKFTEEELQSLSDLQVKYNTITNQFGQLAIAKLNLDKQTEVVNDQEFKLQEELEQAREQEQEILNEITEKYGPGQLDPQSGVFTPTTEIQQSTED
tara:strand:+ start:432 stop:737 length:306 start_codon:yes stop_codon:yes gene_type:complete